MSDNTPPSRPLRRDAARNRDALVAAAREVFATRGFDASMDEIAHHAGLGVGTAYRHFANKYELANAIFDEAVEAFVNSAGEAMTTPNAWDGLVSVIEQTLEAQTENRAMREILLGVNQDAPDHHESMTASLTPLFERAQRDGLIRADAEASDVSLLVVMLCTVADTTGGRSPYLWRRYLPVLLAGLRPEGPPLPVPALSPDELRATLAQSNRRAVTA